MISRLGSRADAVVDPRVVEAAAIRGEDEASEGRDSETYLKGARQEDSKGSFLSIEGASLSPEGAVGMCVSYEDGGTEVLDETRDRFVSMFPDGILMVIDVYAHQVAMYKAREGEIVSASVLMRE